jgi:hypothetical protein
VLVGDALAVLRGLAVPEPVAPPEGQMGLFGAEELTETGSEVMG